MSRKRRRLSPTSSRDALEPTASASNVGASPSDRKNGFYTSSNFQGIAGYSSGVDGSNERYRLLVCGCNLYGQLTNSPGWGIETAWKAAEADINWLGNQDPDIQDVPAEPTREPNLFVTVDTPTVVATARESMRVLYAGTHSICVERDGNIYLRGLLPTLAPGNLSNFRELPIALPLGAETRNIVKALGTRWAFIGFILSDGSVYTFSLAKWSFARLICAATEDPVSDILINKTGEVCFLYCHHSSNTNRLSEGASTIKLYSPVPSITEHLYDASLQSFVTNDIEPISTFNTSTRYSEEGICLQESFISVASTSTGFIGLTSKGNVYTYGDRRFNSLGRQLDAITTSKISFNAQGWGKVTALEGIAIKQISANPGGHVQGALAEDGTVYLWGGDGTENICFSVASDSQNREYREEEVFMIDITHAETGEPVEFESIAVGEDHVVLIEKGGREVWVSGGSDMGQTGYGREYRCLPTALEVDRDLKKQKGRWRRWTNAPLQDSDKIVQARCGSGSTLLILDSQHTGAE